MLVDSNILVYAINQKSPKNKIARDFLFNYSKTESFEIAHQNILEALRILTHPKYPNPYLTPQAKSDLDKFSRQIKIIHPKDETLYILYKFVEKYSLKSNLIFDAYLAATALSNDINTIATDNEKDFQIFEEINIFNPFKEVLQ